jgi:hypothetical protein
MVKCLLDVGLLARALNSAVECHLHTVEVIGSNPIAPTTSTIPVTSPLPIPPSQLPQVTVASWYGGRLRVPQAPVDVLICKKIHPETILLDSHN